MLWGLAAVLASEIFTPMRLLALHTVFEVWELWAFGYVDDNFKRMVPSEMIDLIFDTIFAMLGMWVVLYLGN